MGFYFSFLDYFKEEVLQFIDIIDNSNSTIRLVKNGKPIINFQNKMMRKQNKYMIKKKAWLNNPYTPMKMLITYFKILLLFYFAFISGFKPLVSLLSYFKSLTSLLFCFIFVLLFCPIFVLLFCPILALVLGSIAILLIFLLLSLTSFYLIFSTFRIFK